MRNLCARVNKLFIRICTERMRPRISVVIPTIEERSIFGLVRDIRRLLGRGTEVIIVDKSSRKYRRRLGSLGVKVIAQRDRGVENAIMMGLRAANGELLASIDADGTHGISGLASGARIVESGKADMVLGNRMGSLEQGSMGAYIIIGNAFLSKLFSILYRERVHDVLTGLFVMKREAFESIRDETPYRAGISFFAIELARRGYRLKEVDIRYYKRKYGKSKLTRSKLAYGVNVASHLIRQIRDYSPLLIFGGIGIVLAMIGLAVGAAVVVQFIQSGTFSLTGRALFSFMLIVIGLLFFVSGLILDILIEIERRLMRK